MFKWSVTGVRCGTKQNRAASNLAQIRALRYPAATASLSVTKQSSGTVTL